MGGVGGQLPKNLNRAFSHDVTSAILVFQNNETAAVLVYQSFLLFQQICIDADHVSENALLLPIPHNTDQVSPQPQDHRALKWQSLFLT